MAINPDDIKAPAFLRRKKRRNSPTTKPTKSRKKKAATKKVKPKKQQKKALKKKRVQVSKPKKKAPAKEAKEKPVAVVTHYFDQIKVVILKTNTPLKQGDRVRFESGHKQRIESMQHNREVIKTAKKGIEIGIKTEAVPAVGEEVFREA